MHVLSCVEGGKLSKVTRKVQSQQASVRVKGKANKIRELRLAWNIKGLIRKRKEVYVSYGQHYCKSRGDEGLEMHKGK